MKFLELGAYPDGADKRKHHSIRMMAIQYILYGGQLYRRSYDGICLHCLKKEAAKKVMEKIHQENVSQENPKDGVLLEYDRDRLCGLCEKLA